MIDYIYDVPYLPFEYGATREYEMDWSTWLDEVEASLPSGNADGDVAEDGYSMDTFYEMYITGWSPAEAADAARADHEAFL